MQHAKDSFYIALRDRIAALNPLRTVVVRGTLRPAVVVEENELTSSFPELDTFRLRWRSASVDASGALPMITMRCEIHYATRGSSGATGMDRGRALAAMDAELCAAINAEPQRCTKRDYSATNTPAMQTQIFWNDIALQEAKRVEDCIERIATVDVFSYQGRR